MKISDNIMDMISECDFDTFNEEIDILFGDRFSASSIVDSHVFTNSTVYSERFAVPQMLENEEEIKEANECFFPVCDRISADKILQ